LKFYLNSMQEFFEVERILIIHGRHTPLEESITFFVVVVAIILLSYYHQGYQVDYDIELISLDLLIVLPLLT
jgi:hypothetical protein